MFLTGLVAQQKERREMALLSRVIDTNVPNVTTEMLACIGQARLMMRDAVRGRRFADAAATETLVAELVTCAEAGVGGCRDVLDKLAVIAGRVYQ